MRPEDFVDSLSMDHLLNEYAGWVSVHDSDDYDLIAKTKTLYRFAINNFNEPGIALLLKAIKAFEAAAADPQ